MKFRNVSKSGTLTLNEKMKSLEKAGQPIYKFGFGESPFMPPTSVLDAFRASAHRKDYTPVAGLPKLREKIATFHSEVDGYPIDAKQILVAPGTKPLLYNLMHAFESANVFLPAPSWVSYAPQARLAGHQIFKIPTTFQDRWRVKPEILDQILADNKQIDKHNLMVLNYPGNPDGLSYTRHELEALTIVLRKHQVWVISDEIYALLHHDGQHVSLASIYPERTLVTTGLSKWCGAGGWRLGALFIPAEAPQALTETMIGLGSEVYSCAPAPVQVAGISAYELDSSLYDYLSNQRKILKAIGQRIYNEISSLGVLVHPPQGAFYLLLDFSPFGDKFIEQGIITDTQLCETILDSTGVALLPGTAFGLAANAYTARLAYVDFDGVSALKNTGELESNPEQYVSGYARKMLDGIQKLNQWLH